MSYLAIFKRVVPFLLTFTAGLLIASIFIPIAAPNFNRSQSRRMKWREFERIKIENSDLRIENERLKQENEMLRQNKWELSPSDLKLRVPTGETQLELPAPPQVKHPRHPKDR